jgi:hypothetical protein
MNFNLELSRLLSFPLPLLTKPLRALRYYSQYPEILQHFLVPVAYQPEGEVTSLCEMPPLLSQSTKTSPHIKEDFLTQMNNLKSLYHPYQKHQKTD